LEISLPFPVVAAAAAAESKKLDSFEDFGTLWLAFPAIERRRRQPQRGN
jgi:hypothetical protein